MDHCLSSSSIPGICSRIRRFGRIACRLALNRAACFGSARNLSPVGRRHSIPLPPPRNRPGMSTRAITSSRWRLESIATRCRGRPASSRSRSLQAGWISSLGGTGCELRDRAVKIEYPQGRFARIRLHQMSPFPVIEPIALRRTPRKAGVHFLQNRAGASVRQVLRRRPGTVSPCESPCPLRAPALPRCRLFPKLTRFSSSSKIFRPHT